MNFPLSHWAWRDGPKGELAPDSFPTASIRRKAGDLDRKSDEARARWTVIDGLGRSTKAVFLEPAVVENTWEPATSGFTGRSLEYNSIGNGGSEAVIYSLPPFRLDAGRKLGIAVRLDDAAPQIREVPGSNDPEIK